MVFIVVCGTDGSGKATQVNLLRERLIKEGHDIITTDFPRYGEDSAKMVENYLNGKFGTADEVGPYRGSILYAIDRWAASFQMKKWIKEGKIILSNRYVSANKGHQTAKISDPAERDRFLDWLNNLEYNIFEIPKEDLNVLLYVPPEIGQKLVENKEARSYTGKKKDIHEADINHLRKAAQAYRYVAEKESWKIIDCTRDGKLLTISEINDKLYDAVKGHLPSADKS